MLVIFARKFEIEGYLFSGAQQYINKGGGKQAVCLISFQVVVGINIDN